MILDYKIKVPVIPKDNRSKKKLGDTLLADRLYAKHWMDSVTGTVDSVESD